MGERYGDYDLYFEEKVRHERFKPGHAWYLVDGTPRFLNKDGLEKTLDEARKHNFSVVRLDESAMSEMHL